MKNIMLVLTLVAAALPAAPVAFVATAHAQGRYGDQNDGRDHRDDRGGHDGRGDRGGRDDRGHYGNRGRQQYDRRYYSADGRYRTPRRIGRNDYVWRGGDGRYYCRRNNGTTGLIIGGIAGGVVGNLLDGGQNRTLGTLLGAGGGALLGRSVDRGQVRCR